MHLRKNKQKIQVSRKFYLKIANVRYVNIQKAEKNSIKNNMQISSKNKDL